MFTVTSRSWPHEPNPLSLDVKADARGVQSYSVKSECYMNMNMNMNMCMHMHMYMYMCMACLLQWTCLVGGKQGRGF